MSKVVKVSLHNRIQWLALRLTGIELTLEEVQKRRYFPGKTIKFDKASLDDDATKNQFDKATLIFELEQKRRDTLTDKVKTLLNLGTFLLTFSVALFNLIKVQSSLYPIIIIFSLAAIICILQCLSFLSMNSISVPAFESNNNDDELETYDISKEYALPDHIEELVTCCDYNHRGNDFLADVYRSGQRYFLIALICIILVLILQPLQVKSDNSKNNTYIFATEIVSDKLVDEIAVEFDFDKYAIKEDTSRHLTDKLSKYKNGYNFSIVGYTDKIGSIPYNDKLGLMRASSVAKWLIDNYNIPPKHVTIMPFGITQKFGNNHGINLNRKAVIYVLK